MMTDMFSNIIAGVAIIFGLGLAVSMLVALFWDYFHFHKK